MCGILGAFGVGGPVGSELRHRLGLGAERMAHRGPDDSGSMETSDGIAVLHHRRLSIIDLSERGRQPISNASGDAWIIFNGEIYNYRAIREELQAKGYMFKTSTDTEVILLGYQEYGPDILQKLRGMFAFAIYDAKSRSVFLARDRIGIKPLYYQMADGALVVSSSLQALLKATGKSPELDAAGVYEYLFLGFVTAPGTVLTGVRKLPPAHFALFSCEGDGIKPQRYWEVGWSSSYKVPRDEQEAVELLDQKIIDAVSSRLVADVPVSVFLSGGLDSGLVASIAAELSPGPLHSFTLGFKDADKYNELADAAEVSSHLGFIHREIIIDKSEVLDFSDSFVDYQEEPNSNPIQLMVYFLSKLVRDNGIKVTLAGDGGDELFFGYNEWVRYLRFHDRYARILDVIPKGGGRFVAACLNPLLPAWPKYDMVLRLLRGEHLYYASQGFTGNILSKILNPGFKTFSERGRDAVSRLTEDYRNSGIAEKSYLNWMRYVTLKTHLVEDYMGRSDNMGMANGIEIRVPLLDHNLVEYAFGLPGELLLAGHDKKHLMKKVAERHMPKEFIYRKKRGFSGPINIWLRHILKDRISVLKEFNKEQQIFTDSFVDSMTRPLPEKGMNWAAFWGVYNLAEWFNKLRQTA